MYALDEHTVLRRYRRRNVPDAWTSIRRTCSWGPEHLDAAIARRVADPNLNQAERDAARAVRVDRR